MDRLDVAISDPSVALREVWASALEAEGFTTGVVPHPVRSSSTRRARVLVVGITDREHVHTVIEVCSAAADEMVVCMVHQPDPGVVLQLLMAGAVGVLHRDIGGARLVAAVRAVMHGDIVLGGAELLAPLVYQNTAATPGRPV